MIPFALRPAAVEDDGLIAENFRRMWANHKLHAPPLGRMVYEKLGFQNGNEMFLEL